MHTINQCMYFIVIGVTLYYHYWLFFNFHKVFSVNLVYLFENTFPWILKYSNCFASKQKWNWWPFSCCVCLWISKYILTSRKELKYIDDSLCGLQKCKHNLRWKLEKQHTCTYRYLFRVLLGTYVPGI